MGLEVFSLHFQQDVVSVEELRVLQEWETWRHTELLSNAESRENTGSVFQSCSGLGTCRIPTRTSEITPHTVPRSSSPTLGPNSAHSPTPGLNPAHSAAILKYAGAQPKKHCAFTPSDRNLAHLGTLYDLLEQQPKFLPPFPPDGEEGTFSGSL